MIRKTMLALFYIAFMSVTGNVVVARTADSEPQEKLQKKEIPNPEKEARRRTDEMDKLLQLTEKQYKKIYKLYLKEEKEKVEKMSGFGGGMPPMGGGMMPPGGNGRPPMGMPPAGERPDFGNSRPEMGDRKSIEEDMKKRREAKLKKIRKILTDEQYDKWISAKPEVMDLPPLHDGAAPVPEEKVVPEV